jgi:hypothetical protein
MQRYEETSVRLGERDGALTPPYRILALTPVAVASYARLMPPAPAPDWRSPWLRINHVLRDLTKLFGVREARPMLKEELNRAVSVKAAMKPARGWWS